MSTKGIGILALALVAIAGGLLIYGNGLVKTVELLNVSYDPTREVYTEIDSRFAERLHGDTGGSIVVRQYHGGSARQARAVAQGLAADVVTLGLPSDVEGLHRLGLVANGWQAQFPNNAEPYFSTIVFVVRRGNPRHIQDWADLAQSGLEIVTPNPKTSANGQLSFLAAWGSVIVRGGTEEAARELVSRIYGNTRSLADGARDSTNIFELAGEGDVHLTWESEAIRETRASHGHLQIIYPPVSIRAEPSVAVVARYASQHHLQSAAQAYLSFLFSDEAQEIFAKDGYRPWSQEILGQHRDLLPNIELFSVTSVARTWDEARVKFFADGGIFDVLTQQLTAENRR